MKEHERSIKCLIRENFGEPKSVAPPSSKESLSDSSIAACAVNPAVNRFGMLSKLAGLRKRGTFIQVIEYQSGTLSTSCERQNSSTKNAWTFCLWQSLHWKECRKLAKMEKATPKTRVPPSSQRSLIVLSFLVALTELICKIWWNKYLWSCETSHD